MMDMNAMEPYGRALLDYLHGDVSANVVVHRDDGYTSNMPASIYFRKPSDFSPIEQTALKLCRGHVLDVGAGAGCHSLALQGYGMKVLAIDVSPYAIEIMAQRKVDDVLRVDVFEYHERRFFTLLMMLHGIGMVQTLSGLDYFLSHAHKLLVPGGQILFDSLDVRCTDNPTHLAYQEANRRAGRYFGEFRMQFEYQGKTGPLFGWLHVDPETLADHAGRTGWACEVAFREDGGNYLARLT